MGMSMRMKVPICDLRLDPVETITNRSIESINLEHNKWDEALALIEEHPQFAPQVYLPYAQWLVEQDRFEEAQEAFDDWNAEYETALGRGAAPRRASSSSSAKIASARSHCRLFSHAEIAAL